MRTARAQLLGLSAALLVALPAFSQEDVGVTGPAFKTGDVVTYDRIAPDGRWLLDRPILIVIDDTVFLHGGLAPVL